eukprot:maker-scaffold3395_size8863-snap-gene-0.1 protein:Tk02779 transcript:maker-scaffold3395_size8863-snap-gene-0.1-mRNA-1 annotation:"hypothetical protein"
MAKGYFGRRKNVWTVAKNAVEKALCYAYRDRRQKKRNFRALWILRINAGARLHGMSYSRFMGAVKKNGIELNRKVLADLAMHHPEAYPEYLGLEKLLDSQHPKSLALGKEAHEEMLFIVTHQAYEIWFKQIIHELESVVHMFSSHLVDERNLGTAVARLNRIDHILKLLVEQISVLETMAPLDFMEFRNLLVPASGFQSYQFRKIEVMLGLKPDQRLTYNGKSFTESFSKEEAESLLKVQDGNNLLHFLNEWLDRTPFLENESFNFLANYEKTVEELRAKEIEELKNETGLTEAQKTLHTTMLNGTKAYFEEIFDEAKHNERLASGEVQLSYKATVAALFIQLYRDQPILQLPYQLLNILVEIDVSLANWRYRHAQMVRRMIGQKIGTGGSSGYDYLRKTAESNTVFMDLQKITSLMIPRTELMPLPEEVTEQLGFYFSCRSQKSS